MTKFCPWQLASFDCPSLKINLA
uniref:Uncharacterized protein n=1 Tax=Rhizophora mucronata TaxID=61149 RepID=A0A2P2NDM4_RHIMU